MSPRLEPGELNSGRPSRPAAPGSGGPGRRPGAPTGKLAHAPAWDLWNFRALFPAADEDDLMAVRREQQSILAREREALARLRSGDEDLLSPGRAYLAAHPELATGITVSLHTGPYQLLAEPWLHAGLEPLVLLNASALPRFRDAAQTLQRQLRHRGTVSWAAVGEPGFMRNVVMALQDRRPVLAYLDGNSGEGGSAGTRERGLLYELPGRDILVRTGLARLAFRVDMSLHRVSLRWDDGRVVWDGASSLRPRRDGDPGDVTRRLFDWAIGVIRERPAQWQYWAMLRDSSACFAGSRLRAPLLAPGLKEDALRGFTACCDHAARTTHLVLRRDVEVWPGEVLADLSCDRFYAAAGLCDGDLDFLREGRRPTLAQVRDRHGEAWLRFHGLRLVLLGIAGLDP